MNPNSSYQILSGHFKIWETSSRFSKLPKQIDNSTVPLVYIVLISSSSSGKVGKCTDASFRLITTQWCTGEFWVSVKYWHGIRKSEKVLYVIYFTDLRFLLILYVPDFFSLQKFSQPKRWWRLWALQWPLSWMSLPIERVQLFAYQTSHNYQFDYKSPPNLTWVLTSDSEVCNCRFWGTMEWQPWRQSS